MYAKLIASIAEYEAEKITEWVGKYCIGVISTYNQ